MPINKQLPSVPFYLLPSGLLFGDFFHSSSFFGLIALGFKRKKKRYSQGSEKDNKLEGPEWDLLWELKPYMALAEWATSGVICGASLPDPGAPVGMQNPYHRSLPSTAKLSGKTGLKGATP